MTSIICKSFLAITTNKLFRSTSVIFVKILLAAVVVVLVFGICFGIVLELFKCVVVPDEILELG